MIAQVLRAANNGVAKAGPPARNLFLFSSRRRHPRCLSDWSSDCALPISEQKSLDNWRDGLLTEAGFLTLARWYEFWGYHWDYYRDIFLYARDNRIRTSVE